MRSAGQTQSNTRTDNDSWSCKEWLRMTRNCQFKINIIIHKIYNMKIYIRIRPLRNDSKISSKTSIWLYEKLCHASLLNRMALLSNDFLRRRPDFIFHIHLGDSLTNSMKSCRTKHIYIYIRQYVQIWFLKIVIWSEFLYKSSLKVVIKVLQMWLS